MNPETEAQIADLLLWRDHDARHLLEVAAKNTMSKWKRRRSFLLGRARCGARVTNTAA